MRAVIHANNILIDNSFDTLSQDAKLNISLHLTEKGGQGHD